MTIDLSAMISATMSRISSRAASCSMVASWLRSIESISALKIADLVWKYSLSRADRLGAADVDDVVVAARLAAPSVERVATSTALLARRQRRRGGRARRLRGAGSIAAESRTLAEHLTPAVLQAPLAFLRNEGSLRLDDLAGDFSGALRPVTCMPMVR